MYQKAGWVTRTFKICAVQGDQVKGDEVGGTCGTCVGQEKFVQGLVGKTGGKITLGRHRSTLEDDTKMDLKRIGRNSVNCIHVTAFVNAVLKLVCKTCQNLD